jgi:hypothetical protein
MIITGGKKREKQRQKIVDFGPAREFCVWGGGEHTVDENYKIVKEMAHERERVVRAERLRGPCNIKKRKEKTAERYGLM